MAHTERSLAAMSMSVSAKMAVYEVVEVVAVDGADVVEAELLEERAASDHAARVLVELGVGLLNLLGEELVDALGDVAEVLEGLGRDEARRVRRERPRGGSTSRRGRAGGQGDLAVVVVDDDDARVEVWRVVHGLVRHAARDGAVADDGNGVALPRQAALLEGHRHAQRRRD